MWEYAVILLILAVVGYLIFQPLLRPKGLERLSPQRKEVRERALEKQKEELYTAIKEMDFDFGMGKISKEDYQGLRSEYKSKALEILKELDTVDKGDETDEAIEKEVRQLRKKRVPKSETGDERGTTWQINFCPQCGRKVAPEDNFCQGCGRMLREE